MPKQKSGTAGRKGGNRAGNEKQRPQERQGQQASQKGESSGQQGSIGRGQKTGKMGSEDDKNT